MSSSRLHSLTAIYLAVIYGAVGIAGPSIHYLASLESAFWSSEEAAGSVGYYHVHAPDYHGHFHHHSHRNGPGHRHDGNRGHAHHHGHSHIELGVHDTQENIDHGPSYSTSGIAHDPHGCPALALISTIKLGHASPASAPHSADAASRLATVVRRIHPYQPLTCASPRGPPAYVTAFSCQS